MSSRGSKSWLFQRVSGFLLFITLGVHFYIYHYFMGPGMWGFDSIGYGANDLETLRLMAEADPTQARFYALASLFAAPLWKVFDLLFITLGCYHGFYGIVSNIEDYVTDNGKRQILTYATYLAGFMLWVMGVVSVISFNPQLF